MSFTPDKNSVPYAASGADLVPDLGFVVNTVNGRTYQRRQRAMLDVDGNEIFFDVWDAISDRKNTTYIGAEDPTKNDRDSVDAMQKYHAGDMWWDTADMELRVLHSPKLGTTTSAGEEIEVYGRKAWVSSTHPTAYMLGDNVGSNKNQNLGNCYLTGGFQEYLYSGDTLSAELSMPFYTGDDTLDSEVPDVDKRYTVTYRAIPTHNGDSQFIANLKQQVEDGVAGAENELKQYENIVVPDPDNFGLVDLTIGQIAPDASGEEQAHILLLEAVVTVKTAYIDDFITNTSDGVITAPQAVATLTPIKKVYPRKNLPVPVPVSIIQRTFGSILDEDGLNEADLANSISGVEYPDNIDKDALVDWVQFPDIVTAIPEGAINDDPIEIFGRINNTGLGPEGGLEDSDAVMWNQIPYNSIFVDTNRFGLVKLRFEYADENSLKENTLEFYLTGYRQNVLGINVPDVEDESLYTTKKSTVEYDSANDIHYVSLMVDYTDLPPDARFYMVVRDTNTGDLKHELKGALYVNNRNPFILDD